MTLASMLTRAEARAFYDRFGLRQDSQAFYEDPAIDELLRHAGFGVAEVVCELGCGTGRLAERLLAEGLPNTAKYLGLDLSPTMVGLAHQRLARFGERARVEITDGTPCLPLASGSVDRFLSTYVFDLLPSNEIEADLAEAHRVLRSDGQLCLVSLTHGQGGCGRWVSWLWERVHSLRPALVGGCRPTNLVSFVHPPRWSIQHLAVVTAYCIPSEVIVAKRQKDRLKG
jgi:ubiquinone/menaquinone biosynthesis C-methylase UbiE